MEGLSQPESPVEETTQDYPQYGLSFESPQEPTFPEPLASKPTLPSDPRP